MFFVPASHEPKTQGRDKMDLNFDQCLTLLIIGFVLGLILVRASFAMWNRGFQLVDYAKIQLSGKKGGGFNLKQMAMETFGPMVMDGFKKWVAGGQPPQK